MTEELLTQEEHDLAATLATVVNKFATLIKENGNNIHDLNEVVNVIHILQDKVLANAAARAFPDRYRLLGATSFGEAK